MVKMEWALRLKCLDSNPVLIIIWPQCLHLYVSVCIHQDRLGYAMETGYVSTSMTCSSIMLHAHCRSASSCLYAALCPRHQLTEKSLIYRLTLSREGKETDKRITCWLSKLLFRSDTHHLCSHFTGQSKTWPSLCQ